MNGHELHAPSPPLAAHKLLVWIWQMEMLQCQCADQSARFSGLNCGKCRDYVLHHHLRPFTKISQRAHMLGQVIDLIMEPYISVL